MVEKRSAPAPPPAVNKDDHEVKPVAFNIQLSESDVIQSIARADSDGNGAVEEEEFKIKFEKYVQEHGEQTLKADEVFAALDLDKSGIIDGNEIKEFFKLTKPEIKKKILIGTIVSWGVFAALVGLISSILYFSAAFKLIDGTSAYQTAGTLGIIMAVANTIFFIKITNQQAKDEYAREKALRILATKVFLVHA